MGDYELQVGLSADRRAIELFYVALIIVALGSAIVFFTSFIHCSEDSPSTG